jgi:hypothetical protein
LPLHEDTPECTKVKHQIVVQTRLRRELPDTRDPFDSLRSLRVTLRVSLQFPVAESEPSV